MKHIFWFLPLHYYSHHVVILIIRGSEDKMVTAESSKEVASWLRNGTYSEIDDASHPLEKVDMDVLVREIVGFCGLES